jgi:perosamine synthetase
VHSQQVHQRVVDFIRAAFPNEKFIPLHAPVFAGNEKAYVNECIDSTYVSSVGKFVDRFEQEFAAYTGAKHCIALVNGTAALYIALQLAGVKHGDLVITQALSFIATCNSISHLGASPVFVDIDQDTLGLSPVALEEFLSAECSIGKDGICRHNATGRHITACVPMHTFGHSCIIDQIATICKQYNISLVEDAAESVGSLYGGKHTGTFGLMGTFSFNGNKTITCGGGGCIITDDTEIAKRAKHLTTQAKVPHRWEFVHDSIGYNFRLPNINAGLLCAQLEQLEYFIAQKRELAEVYANFFQQNGIRFVSELSGSRSNYWLNAVILSDREERDAFLSLTNDHGVMTRPVWELMFRLPMFKDCIRSEMHNSIFIADRLVNIPSSVRSTVTNL